MPHRNAFPKALARINTKISETSTTPAFQPPFNDRPSLPTIKVTTSSSSTSLSSTSNSPIIHNAPFPPDSPTQPGYSPLTPPISPLTPPISPLTPPPDPNPSYHLHNRYLRTLVLLLTPPLMHAASNILAHAGYGTGPSSTVTEADEIEFLRNLDAFLCLLDPRCEGDAIAPTAGESSGEGNWVRSVYLDRLMRGLDTERVSVVEKWVEGRFGGGEGLGAYVRVLDGFLGVLEGRTGDPVVERAMRGVDQ